MSDYLLDWDATGADGDATLSSASGGGNVAVTVSTPTNGNGDSFALAGGLLTSDHVCNPTSTLVTFDTAVQNVTFALHDVDANQDWDDKVTIVARDADGNIVPVTFSELTGLQTVSGNSVEGTHSGDHDVQGPGDGDSITVTIPGPIVSLEILHDNGDSDDNSGAISVGDIRFDAAMQPLDGIVEGTAGDDVIDTAYTGDPDGDLIDAGDAILPGEAPDDDIVDAGAGDDVVEAGLGNDEVYGGAGDDVLRGNPGDDVLYGDSSLGGGSVRESFEWDLAPDPNGPAPIEHGDGIAGFSQNTGSVEVTFTVLGGDDDDVETTFADNAQLVGGIDSGSETVDGTSSLASLIDDEDESVTYALDFSKPVENVSFRINDIDGDGVVTIIAYDADGTPTTVNLTGGSELALLDTDGVPGADTADSQGGYDDDTSPDYSILVEIPGPVSRIEIVHAQDGEDASGINVTDVFYDVSVPQVAPAGDDRLFGGDGSDVLYGEGGDDRLDGGVHDDDADILIGGDDADTFTGVGIGDDVQGGAGGNDDDTLDLTGTAVPGGGLKVTVTGPDSDGNGVDGFVTYFDEKGDETGTLTFSNIENIVPCFTPGTTIATPRGERLVEDLVAGDKVITRDNGIQEIRWIGRRTLNGRELTLAHHLRPVLIRAGALGNGLPERDTVVSPNHRVLVANDRTALYFEEREVLVAAKHLVNNRGVHVVDTLSTTYVHFMCDQHEVVLSNGAWTESFQPGDVTLGGMGNAQRNEIFDLFPDLKTEKGREGYRAARMTLKKHEARLLN